LLLLKRLFFPKGTSPGDVHSSAVCHYRILCCWQSLLSGKYFIVFRMRLSFGVTPLKVNDPENGVQKFAAGFYRLPK
jgi:hypothetical protein